MKHFKASNVGINKTTARTTTTTTKKQQQQFQDTLLKQEQQQKILELFMKRKSNENTSTFFSHDSVVTAISEFKYNLDEEVTFAAMKKSLKKTV